MGQSIRVVPIVLSGTLKISRVNEDGQELLLFRKTDERLVSCLREKSRISGSSC